MLAGCAFWSESTLFYHASCYVDSNQTFLVAAQQVPDHSSERIQVFPHGFHSYRLIDIQSTLVISKSKGRSEILRDIRSSTYRICTSGEKINQTTTFHR